MRVENQVPGAWMEDLTWPEVAGWIERDPVLIVPIGAICKEHGHHLPMKTDFLVARELADRIRRQLPVLVAPVVTFGYYPAFVRYPGSQHLPAGTFVRLLKEILRKFTLDGFTNVAIINTGVSTEGPVEIAARDIYAETGTRVQVADIRRLGSSASSILEQSLGGHADESETSTVLAIDPSLVRLDRACPDYGNLLEAPSTVFERPSVFADNPDSLWDHSETGTRGDPSRATREKGEEILDAMTQDLVDGLRAIFRFD